jgi:hypothetical protein
MPLKPYRRTGFGQDAAADFAEQLTRDPFVDAFLSGAVITVDHDGTNLNIDVPHGLDRAYVGAMQICASESDPVVVCLLPEDAEADGVDITRYARFRQPTADAMRTRWRIF